LEIIDSLMGKWTVLVITALSENEALRHGELRRALPGISQKVLTQVLRTLERNGIVTRTAYAQVPPHVEYALTDVGASLIDVLTVLCSWAHEHQDQVEAARKRYAQNHTR
jgi:DNA-binding HxlR family transcriptional regulator